MSDFEIQWLCEPLKTAPEIKADELAKQYYQDAEAYDRTVCSGPIVNGAIMPNNPRESALVNLNAITLLNKLRNKLPELGITET